MNTYLIIGAGKLAKHLNHYLTLLGLSVSSWDRSQDPHLLRTKIDQSNHVLLAISDSAIETFYLKNLAGLDKNVVHFSGALNINGLIAAHPLMSFGPEVYEFSTYKRIHFVVTGASSLQQALPDLDNPFSLLAQEYKALYHGLCVMGGNLPILLWQKMFSEFSKWGIPQEAGALYLQAILSNTLRNPDAALTGPIPRRDRSTIVSNINALKNDPFQDIYIAFIKARAPDLLEGVHL